MREKKPEFLGWAGFIGLACMILAVSTSDSVRGATTNCQLRQCVEIGGSTAVLDKNGTVLYYSTCRALQLNPGKTNYLAEGFSEKTAHNDHYGTDSVGGKSGTSVKMVRYSGK